MNGFEDLQQIWMTENRFNPNEKIQIIKLITKYQISKKRNIFLLIAATIILFFVFGAVVIYSENLHWTRTLGEILIFIGLILTLALKIKTLRKTTENELLPNDEFLNVLKESLTKKKKRDILQITAIIVIGLGYGLFIFQDIADKIFTMILSYSLLILFLGFMYFKFRLFTQSVSKNRSAKLLQKIEDLKRDFK